MPPSDSSHDGSEGPDIDDRLVAPETRYEMWDGELVFVPPSDYPHAERHSKVQALVEAHVAPGFTVACDLLTRTSKTNDIAPDVSVYPSARHPVTGRRQLEQLAFEIVSTVSLGDTAKRAAELVRRGVRRVFAIHIDRERALEWSSAIDSWSVLDHTTHIEDAALAAPLPIQELVRAGKSDDAVARALVIKRNPVIEEVRSSAKHEGFVEGRQHGRAEGWVEGKQQGWDEGKQQGLAEARATTLTDAILEVLDARGIALTAAERTAIRDESDAARLRRWIQRAALCATASELFGDA